MGEVKQFRDLSVWQRSMDLAIAVYRATKEFPPDERFGMTSQMRRAAVSIPSNIAEGHARHSTGEYIYSLGIARGSLAELETQAELAHRLGMLATDPQKALVAECIEIGRMLSGLVNSLRAKS
jgi:four helix bundle protein